MERKHTPGPWHITDVRNQKNGQLRIFGADSSGLIANVMARHLNCEANAHLIAAAPEMLSLLEELYRWLDDIGDGAPDASSTAKQALNAAAEIRILLDKIKG
jgi:hypothetical protein